MTTADVLCWYFYDSGDEKFTCRQTPFGHGHWRFVRNADDDDNNNIVATHERRHARSSCLSQPKVRVLHHGVTHDRRRRRRNTAHGHKFTYVRWVPMKNKKKRNNCPTFERAYESLYIRSIHAGQKNGLSRKDERSSHGDPGPWTLR